MHETVQELQATDLHSGGGIQGGAGSLLGSVCTTAVTPGVGLAASPRGWRRVHIERRRARLNLRCRHAGTDGADVAEGAEPFGREAQGPAVECAAQCLLCA